MAQVKGGNLNALAVASKKRIPFLPDVPTFEEAGIKDMVASAWYGIVAPTGTPADVVDTLNKAVNNALKDPQIRAQLEGMGAQVVEGDNTSAEFGAFIQSEITRYAELVKMSGAKPE
jgi:tripartite-type tricarboxylate transporter receptor subunit TctC